MECKVSPKQSKKPLSPICTRDGHHSLDTYPLNNFHQLGLELVPGNNNKPNAKCLSWIKKGSTKIESEYKMAPNRMYRLCWMEKVSQTVSVFNCVSFYWYEMKKHVEALIMTDHKPLFYCLFLISCFGTNHRYFDHNRIRQTISETNSWIESTLKKHNRPQWNIHWLLLRTMFFANIPPSLLLRKKNIDFAKFNCCNSEFCGCFCETWMEASETKFISTFLVI